MVGIIIRALGTSFGAGFQTMYRFKPATDRNGTNYQY
jgi:hypothetical protein